MKLRKILLYNFKNFRDKTVIDFSKDITFLVGPNGFGKTTIFDAIELGLTGDLSRVSSKSRITPETVKYNKPFFQNDINHPVIIKLWLEKENESDNPFIIVRKFECNNIEPKSSNAPVKSLREFKLYTHTELNESFFSDVDDSEKLAPLSQDIIDKFMDIDGKYEIKKIFNLFNYIQQEETTFFLKQSEQKRSDSLSFLLKTDVVERKIERIKKLTRAIGDVIKRNRETLDKLTRYEMADVPYLRIFKHKDFHFDRENLFFDGDISYLESYKKSIQNIINFKKVFSVQEYKKKVMAEDKISEIRTNVDFQEAMYCVILHALINRPKYLWDWEAFTINFVDIFEVVLLEKYILNKDQVISEFNRREQLNIYMDNLSNEITNMTEQTFRCDEGDNLSSDFKSLKSVFLHYQALRSDANQIEKEISELLRLRMELGKKFYELTQHNHVNGEICPFCYSKFQSFEELKRVYDNYQNHLTGILSENSNRLLKVQHDLEDSINAIKDKIKKELESLRIHVDEKLKSRVQILQSKYLNYSQNISGFKNFIQAYTKIVPHELGNLTFNEFKQKYEFNLSEFRSKLFVEDSVYSLFKDKAEDILKKYKEFVNKYTGFDFAAFSLALEQKQKISESIVVERVEELSTKLQTWVDELYPIDYQRADDRMGILQTYFDNNLGLLEAVRNVDLENKICYIEKQSALVKDQQFEKLAKSTSLLIKTKELLESINVKYEKVVRDFKIDVLKKLQVPFFIYSAKMLQNFQQGLGVFLTYKEGEEEDEAKAVIKFKSDSNNDHDAMHQLSSGQLAVVSLAFTLSLNTMFKLSDHIQFLMIDDPIQDMDAMNVLSLIEILRHGLVGNYQLILSTYSDSDALFMGYKFVNSNPEVQVDFKNIWEWTISQELEE